MRYQGKITEWRDEQGFGFITQNSDGKRLFLHIKSFSSRKRRPVLNDIVTYKLAVDNKGRAQAEYVEFAGQDRWSSSVNRETVLPLYFAAVCTFLLVSLPVLGFLNWKILAFYGVLNVITFFMYMFDKAAARRSAQRTPESTLHLLSIMGGWPGALLAQRMFRHKSSKREFQEVYWITVFLHCCAVAWLLTPYGRPVLNIVNGLLA